MMFGVILFLRLGLLVAHTGLLTMLAIIACSLLVMLVTSFSIASISTNMEVGPGGVYYIMSRSLGMEVGGALGLTLYFSQLISISLTASGFAYSLVELFPQFSVTHIEIITLLVLTLISSISASWALKTQVGILTILLVALGSVFLGSSEHIHLEKASNPFYSDGHLSFWGGFALFFPALTGIEAGMALSGNLKDPSRSLMYGNIISLLVVAGFYAALSTFAFYSIPKELLISDPTALVDFAYSPALVRIGIWGATLSSCLGSILGAPRMLQMMAEDGLVPDIFSRVYGKFQEPLWALLFTALVSIVITVTTSIDQIIPILTMTCLISYGLLNFVAACAEVMNSVSWRPRIRTPWLLSISNFGVIILMMFMISPGWAFLSIGIVVAICLFVNYRGLEAGFEDIRESLIIWLSRKVLYRLSSPAEHAMNWHPQLLVLCCAPSKHPHMAHLSHSLTRRSGILTFLSVVPEEWSSTEKLEMAKRTLDSYFEKEEIACLTEAYPAPSYSEGYSSMIKAYGIGPIQPNTIVHPLSDDNENEDETLSALIETCSFTQKNLILFKDSASVPIRYFKKARAASRRRIDLWWNGECRKNFDLMISFITTLYSGKVWKGAKVYLHAIAPNPSAEETLRDYLQEFVKESRLRIQVLVHLVSDSSEYWNYVSKFSQDAHLTFMGLTPKEDGEELETYMQSAQEVIDAAQNLKGVCGLVSCYNQVDHRELYHNK